MKNKAGLLKSLRAKLISQLRRIKLFPRLLILMVVCSILPILVVSGAFINEMRIEYEHNRQADLQQSLKLYAAIVDDGLKSYKDQVLVLASSTQTLQRIINYDNENVSQEYFHAADSYKTFLSNSRLTRPRALNVEVLSLDQRIASFPYVLFDGDLQNNEFFQCMNASEGYYCWQLVDLNHAAIYKGPAGVQSMGVETKQLLLSAPVKSKIFNNVVGHVTMLISIDLFSDLEENINFYDDLKSSQDFYEDIIIADDQNRVIYSKHYETGTVLEPAIVEALDQQQSHIRGDGPLHRQQLIQCVHSQESELRFILLSDSATLQERLQQRAPFFCICLVVILWVVVISFLFIRSLMNPISTLIGNMQSLSSIGKVEALADSGNDEITELIQNYNQMNRQIAHLQEEAVLKERHQRRAEYDALVAQINPHFLYNTLDMINWKAYMSKDTEVSRSINNLAMFFRLSMRQEGNSYTVSQELAHVRYYSMIQSERYNGKVTFHYDIREETLNCRILKIVLQPLVENALVHGILPGETGKGNITIRSVLEGEELVLSVIDDGAGLYCDCLTEFRRQEDSHEKYGLYSIHERLKIVFPKQGRLILFKNEFGGTTSQIRVPAIILEDEVQDEVMDY